MQLSELRKRARLTRSAATFRGDEGLVPDVRGSLRPIDCIERKLGTLLPGETSGIAPQLQRGSVAHEATRVVRKLPK
jgi:hypothetical protein